KDEGSGWMVKENVAHDVGELKYVNFSSSLREKLLAKIVSDASYEDFEAAHLSREALEELLTPVEMRALIATLIKRSETSTKWLSFVIRVLPVRAMTGLERKT